jgi:DNA mismatch endonuclease (patch repair protein)
MSKIRSRNTKFEREFIVALKKVTKKKFKTNMFSIKGKPDIVFLKEKLCVFLDSDFWHGWQYPRWKHLLKNKFWRDKIENNRKRDKKTTVILRRGGWKVVRIWEHEIKDDSQNIISKIIKILSSTNVKI